MFSTLTTGITWLAPLMAISTVAQTCDNYGIQNGTSCQCPTGFGGSDCAQAGCGGTIFQGSQRALGSNVTSASCVCSTDWTGAGCNVCQSSNACSTAFASVSSITPNSGNVGNAGAETAMLCNTQPRVYASGQMSCRVEVCQPWTL